MSERTKRAKRFYNLSYLLQKVFSKIFLLYFQKIFIFLKAKKKYVSYSLSLLPFIIKLIAHSNSGNSKVQNILVTELLFWMFSQIKPTIFSVVPSIIRVDLIKSTISDFTSVCPCFRKCVLQYFFN